MQTKIVEGKTLALLSDLRLWPKNPRIADDKNFEKLKRQIIELGIYKPLLITEDGEILGGNQRFKIFKELVEINKDYEWVWVSILHNCWTDEDRLKYAVSDNFSAGEYTREKLAELINIDQPSLLDGYGFTFTDKKTISDFIGELAMTENEVKFKTVEKNLTELGINEETIDIIKTMAQFQKKSEKLEEPEVKGEITGIKFPLIFWITDKILYEQLKELFKTNRKDVYDLEKLTNFVEKIVGYKLPTSDDKLVELYKKSEVVNMEIKDLEDLNEKTDGKKIQLEERKLKIKELLNLC